MNMGQQDTSAEASFQTIMVLWAAMLISQILLGVMVFFIKPELLRFDMAQPLLGKDPAIIVALGVVSVISLVLGLVISQRLVRRAIAERKVALIQTATLVGCALAEAVSFLGIMAAFAFDYAYFFVFSILGIVGTLLQFPRRDDVHAASFKG